MIVTQQHRVTHSRVFVSVSFILTQRASETVEISVAGFPGGLGKIWINEIHYDDNGAGGDTNEGFEVAGPAGTDLSESAVLILASGTLS